VFYVYVLVSESTGKIYIGHTSNLQRRLAEHNDVSHNRRKFTTHHKGPWNPIYYETYPTRSDAMKRERFLKSGKGRQWLNERFGGTGPSEAD